MIAIYRCLYGQDFVRQSINSITNYVDKIFVFYDTVPWGDVKSCKYKGKTVKFPKQFDNILDKIKELNNPKIELIYDHVTDNRNQFTSLVNSHILPNYPKPDMIMIIEVDQVFTQEQVEASIKEFRKSEAVCADTGQIELWRYLNYRIPGRKDRTGVVFWNMKDLDRLPETHRQGEDVSETANMRRLSTAVHNLGFAISEEVMYWKHLTALAFSRKIGDSIPNERWFEDKWLQWNYKTNNTDLEISAGYEHLIPYAMPYDTRDLPEILKFQDIEQRSMFWGRSIIEGRKETLNEFFVKHKDLFDMQSVLEIGPGYGYQYDKIKDAVEHYAIADISSDILDLDVYDSIEDKMLLHTYDINMGKRFDVIHFWHAVHHILKDELGPLVDFLDRHLVPGGAILFNYPTKDGPRSRFGANGIKTTPFGDNEVAEQFKKKFVLDIEEIIDMNVYVVAHKKGATR